jgi:recombination protein RecT
MNANIQHTQSAPPLKLSEELTNLRPELEKVLPAHVTVDKFLRVVNTAISQSPDLYRADRRSLFTSCVKCATDGLLPDGREAALVIFNSKEKFTEENGKKGERWVKKVQYMPMVYGIQKKVRNSGELQSLTCNPVFEHDTFRYWIDDVGEHITHEPNLNVPNRGAFLCAYAIAKTKDGGVYTEVMTRGQIEQVRAVSKAKDNGPWVEWFDEMARKSVIRRLSKRLPMSTDIERVIQRDDDMTDLHRVTAANTRSGVDAAKALLGITAPGNALTGPEDEPPGGGEGDSVIPQFDGPTAIAEIKKATTLKGLEEAYGVIVRDFIYTNRPVPVEVEGAYGDRKLALEQEEA